MEEFRFVNFPDDYRTIHELVRSGHPELALSRGEKALISGHLGRRQSARLHSLLCWLYIEDLHRNGPAATLHGEEAVRLADLVRDAWVKCEALKRLIHAYIRQGLTAQAMATWAILQTELEQNPGALQGGIPALHLLRASVAAVEGDEDTCLVALKQAEDATDATATEMLARIYLQRISLLLTAEQYREARAVALQGSPHLVACTATVVEWSATRAWMMLMTEGPARAGHLVGEALQQARQVNQAATITLCGALRARLARLRGEEEQARDLACQALQRAIAQGRVDVTRQVQRMLCDLLA